MAQENPLAKKYGLPQQQPTQSAPPVIYGPPKTPEPLQIKADQRADKADQRADTSLAITMANSQRAADNSAQANALAQERLALAQQEEERKRIEFETKQKKLANPAAAAAEGERKSAGFYGRALRANTAYEKANIGAPGYITDLAYDVAPGLTNLVLPEDRQAAYQNENEFIAAILRYDSGAAIPDSEYEKARRIYFPLPGDGEEVLRQKSEARRTAMEGLNTAAGILAKPVGTSGATTDGAAAGPLGAPNNEGQTEIMSGFQKSGMEGTNEENALFFKRAYGHSYEQEQDFVQWLNANVGRELTPQEIEAKRQEIGIAPNSGWGDSAAIAQTHARVGVPDENGKVRFVNWGGRGLDTGREKAVEQMAAEDPRGAADAGDLVTQGFTSGLSDEAAGIGAGIGSLLQGKGYSDAYTINRAYENERFNKAREQSGAFGTAAEVLGGVASGGTGLGTVGTGRAAASPIYQGARAGAIGGGVAGFGYSEPGRRFEGTVQGGLIGGALGGGIPAAISTARPTYNALNRALGRDKNIPINQVRNALQADGNTAASAGRRVQEAQARGVPMSLGDTGENARALLGSVTRQRGPSRSIGMETIVGRQEEQFERISAAVRRDLGPTANIRETGEALMDRAKAEAAPLYEAFQNAPGAGATFPKLEQLLQRPSVQKALQRARRIAAEEGEDPTALGFDLNAQGEVVLTRVPSWKTLDYTKRGLDDVVETYRDRTTGRLVLDTEGRAVNGTLRQLIGIVDKANPNYALARSAYAGPARMRDALEKGAKALNKSPDDIAAEIKGLGAAEKEMYRLGVRKNITELLGSKGDYADKAAAISRTPKVRGALVKVFGSGKKVDQFFKTLDDERTLYQTYKEVASGSQTASRQAFDATTGDDTIAQDVVEAASDLKRNGPWAAIGGVIMKIRDAGQLGVGKAGNAARESIAALLTETDPAELVLIQQAARRAAAKQKLLERQKVVKARRQGRAAGIGTVTASENLGAE